MSDNKEWKKSLSSRSIWVRALFMLLFAIVGKIVKFLVVCIAIFQFIYRVIVGSPNAKLLEFSKGLGNYANNIILFLSFNTEVKPYPFSDWNSEQ